MLRFVSILAGTLALGSISLGCGKTGGVKWAESSAPTVRVNQHGYFPGGPKFATLRSESPTPRKVELLRGEAVVWTGESEVRPGVDESSGDRTHTIDFSAFREPGRGYRLRVDGSESFPFDIEEALYVSLIRDSLKYFYHNRSGVPIVRPFVDDDQWARQPGHLSDARVGCVAALRCDYELDASGGWYDAGDQGKYVVNGGIAAWTLLALYERLALVRGDVSRVADSTLGIPESGNGTPDLLDEARFEVEFLLRMQVPDGHERAGMAHHKLHDAGWTALPFEPPTETTTRALHPPSTAATLNLAAVAAQAARLFREYDPAFAERCLRAATKAFAAAEAHPKVFASPMDRTGGGPYDDGFLSDEFYWAAAELFISTGEGRYLELVRSSPHHARFPTELRHPDGSVDGDGVSSSMTWQSTAALGWISLAVAKNNVDPEEQKRLRQGIVDAARVYADAARSEAYLQPLKLGPAKKYPWGSNSFVLNNMVVAALAYDFSSERAFAETVALGMDYLLGRNPLHQSYISGYGEVPLLNPHHRFWAHSKSKRFPPPPPGAVSGGPNSSLQDPQTRKSGLARGMPPQKCYVDHIEAWSVNEVAINWNAPLAFAAVFLDEWRGN